MRLATLIEPLNPLFVEDPLRSENPGVLWNFRVQAKVPVAVGEQFGDRWDINELIEIARSTTSAGRCPTSAASPSS